MSKAKKSQITSLRLILLALGLFICLASIPIRLMYIYFDNGDYYKRKGEQTTVNRAEISPSRGSIYDQAGNLLLTSLPVYTVAIDPSIPKQKLLDEGLEQLSDTIGMLFPEKYSEVSFYNKFVKARNSTRKYLVIAKNINYTQVKRLKELPILKKGRYRGGVIVEKKDTRKQPFGMLAKRTLGYSYSDSKNDVGLEGHYSNELSGEKGYMMVQKISGGKSKPLPSNNDLEPVDGADIVTHIDVRMQDLCHNALYDQLEKFEAQSGTVILMETKTGAIKSMVNLRKGSDGLYRETQNYAVGSATEPGSIIKLISYMVAMEDGYIDTNDLIETGNGITHFYGQRMTDSQAKRGGLGTVSVKRAFELSSNIAIAKIIEDHYKEDPQRYVDRIARLGVTKPIGIDLPGEAVPKIKTTDHPDWSKVTLPWMAYGYEISLAPIQLLSYYNAIANQGELVKPQLIKEVKRAGRIVKTFPKEVLNSKICSDATIGKLQSMMEGVVIRGTAKNIHSDEFSSAGKTGTCQVEYWKSGPKQYQSSFAGYFPVDNPKYSCIVVVQKPKTSIGFYGNIVAGPVFEIIRNGLYTNDSEALELEDETEYALLPKKLKVDAKSFNTFAKQMKWVTNQDTKEKGWLDVSSDSNVVHVTPNFMGPGNEVPNLIGLNLVDALFILENRGLKVKYSGIGKVRKQSLKPGSTFKYQQTITLDLK
ncbi:MAG: penicillin-binding protein [Flavobacteriales bacterium]